MTENDPALALDGVTVRFGGVQAVADVSLRFPRRAGISAVIGPNGAGKTTLLNVMTGIVRPAVGQVLIAGQDRTGMRPDAVFRARVSRTFQGIRLFEHLTVRQNVLLAARSARVGRGGRVPWLDSGNEAARAADAALAAVGVPETSWHDWPPSLTLLERRLVEIARALTARPIALLLDEPAAGLNTAEKARLCDLLRAISRDWACRVVLVEHDMKLVMSVAERVLVMNFGRLLAEGTPAEIRADPAVVDAYLGAAAHA